MDCLVAEPVRHRAGISATRWLLATAKPMGRVDMRGRRCWCTILALMSLALASAAFAEGKPHRIAIHVDQNDPQVMNQALNNATNVIEYYRAKNEDVEVEIVTYGPGLHMLRADTSPVQEPIKALKEMLPPGKIQLSAANHTKEGMETTECHALSVVPGATVLPSRVAPLMAFQDQYWTYLR